MAVIDFPFQFQEPAGVISRRWSDLLDQNPMSGLQLCAYFAAGFATVRTWSRLPLPLLVTALTLQARQAAEEIADDECASNRGDRMLTY
jgi:hypothetical protein